MSPRTGNRLKRLTPFNAYQAKDGWVVIAAGGSNTLWKVICNTISRKDLWDDPRYLTQTDRSIHADEVDAIITAWTKEMTVKEAVRELVEAGVPCAPVREIAEVLADKNLRQQETLTELTHPVMGKIPEYLSWNFPIKFSEKINAPGKAAPFLGQDTFDVLQDAGVHQERILALADDGIIKIR